jgi:uncharacterized protein YoaH (UPF0181 family)
VNEDDLPLRRRVGPGTPHHVSHAVDQAAVEALFTLMAWAVLEQEAIESMGIRHLVARFPCGMTRRYRPQR